MGAETYISRIREQRGRDNAPSFYLLIPAALRKAHPEWGEERHVKIMVEGGRLIIEPLEL